jgi:gliding motility-associated-like protein
MKKLSLFITLFFISVVSFSQDSICDIAAGCSDTPLIFPNVFGEGHNAESGPAYGCLTTQPNPAWYYLGFDESGPVNIEISQINIDGNPSDVDFICYGPFNDPFIACDNLSVLDSSTIIDCSYEPAAVETLNIPNAQIGDFYILLITNFEKTQGSITMTQTNAGTVGAGSTDCSYACSVNLGGDTGLCLGNDYTLTATLGNASLEDTAIYKWYKKVGGAYQELVGETTKEYHITATVSPSSNMYKVEVNAGLCDGLSIDEVEIKYVDVISNLKLTNLIDFDLCDLDGDDDGFSVFDLTAKEIEIANLEDKNDYYFDYFSDVAMTQQIANPSSYTNTSSYNQTIYVAVSHKTFIGCEGITQFNINVFDTPVATDIDNWIYCDDDNDGFYQFDFDMLKNSILDGQDEHTFTISFYKTQTDADAETNPLPLLYTNIDANVPETIFYRIKNNFLICYDTNSFEINVINTPVANPVNDLFFCDDNDNDGFKEFDFNILFDDLLSGQDEADMNISFYHSLVDAEEKILPLNLLHINENAFEEEEIFVRMESVVLEDCFNITSFKIQVIENPIFDIVEDTKYICINLLPQTVNFEIENAQGNYTYSWQDSNGNELSTNTTLVATQVDDYTITATTTDGNNCSTTKVVHVLPAEPANTIQFVMNEFWHHNNFSVDVSVLGSGIYQFALDNIDGPYQDSPLLTNIKPGIHTIYVKEINGCGVESKEFEAFGFSPYFSPNGDGKNDIWKVQGINFKAKAKIYIFDRYGKLIYQFFPALDQGWDGFYNGNPAPEDDYWFTAEMINQKGEQIIRKGHFSLKRTNK